MLLAGLIAMPISALAQDATPAAAPPAKVQELLQLLDDPSVREWLSQHQTGTAAQQPAAPTAEPAAAAEMGPSNYFANRVAAMRAHISALVAALPKLPAEFERAGIILSLEFQERGLLRILVLIAVFVALGFGAERLYHWIGKGAYNYIISLKLDTVAQRLRAVAIRLAYGLGMVSSFAIGSVGGFLALDWPPLLREIVLGYLLAFLAVQLTLVAARFLLAPGADRFRILPMSTEAARFWTLRTAVFIGWLAFGWVTVGLLGTLGMDGDVRRLVAYTLGLVLLAIAIEAIWRRPVDPPAVRSRTTSWLMTVYAVALWLLWVATAMPAFWLLLVIIALPFALRLTQRAVDHLLRPPGATEQEEATPGVIAASLARGLRALIIIGAALLIAWAWKLDFGMLSAEDTVAIRLLRGAVNVVVIVLLADFVWHVLKALIDRKLEGARNPGQPDTEEARRRARMRTLLPIVRNVLFVVLMVMTLLMSLSSLGIEIGPLIAGAGVVGVAIGFGAQTLVKDIISGMFFLLDDAFRVGEYIQSGSYKGTVESFSIRSIKLRHHRGPLYTVPFGELGAVQNMSRDWVIDKLTVGVTYDSDLDKAKKLIKQIGKDLAADAEFGPNILQPLKMQGVEQFGDYAITLRMKMMTKPGEQFVIRRKAYAMIKKAFDENGIHFAFPTVTVAGGDADTAAAAQRAIAAAQEPAEA
jgi:small-conductance mechanosensitive channel